MEQCSEQQYLFLSFLGVSWRMLAAQANLLLASCALKGRVGGTTLSLAGRPARHYRTRRQWCQPSNSAGSPTVNLPNHQQHILRAAPGGCPTEQL